MGDKKSVGRRTEEPFSPRTGDYMRYDQNYGLQNSLGPNKDERVVFADQVLKINRRLRVERRDFILSVEAFYLVMRATKMDQQFYKVGYLISTFTLFLGCSELNFRFGRFYRVRLFFFM